MAVRVADKQMNAVAIVREFILKMGYTPKIEWFDCGFIVVNLEFDDMLHSHVVRITRENLGRVDFSYGGADTPLADAEKAAKLRSDAIIIGRLLRSLPS